MKLNTISRWLKAIYLAPFVMLIANVDTTGEPTGADTQVADADQQGGETQTGADTQTADADQQSQESASSDTSQEGDTTSQETQQGTEGNNKQPHQTTEAERIEQLLKDRAEDRRRLNELEAKLTTKEPEFFAEDVENTVKLNIAKASARIAEIQVQINSNSENITPELADELINLQDWVEGAKTALKENVTKRTEAHKKQEESQKQTEADKQAKELYQENLEKTIKLMAEQDKIPDKLIAEARAFISGEFESNPIFAQEATEILERRGYVAHVRFCIDHAKANMGKKAETVKNEKEEAKQQHPGGATSTTGAQTVNLDALLKKAQDSGSEDDYLAYVAAKRQSKA